MKSESEILLMKRILEDLRNDSLKKKDNTSLLIIDCKLDVLDFVLGEQE